MVFAAFIKPKYNTMPSYISSKFVFFDYEDYETHMIQVTTEVLNEISKL